MEIRNCKKCGRIYNYVLGPNLCPRCRDTLEKKFHEVKQFIYDNPGVGVAEVADTMEVSISQIKQWVREERLQFAEGSITGITCDSCGKVINSGKYCPECKEKMIHNLGGAYHAERKEPEDNEIKPKQTAKMRFLK